MKLHRSALTAAGICRRACHADKVNILPEWPNTSSRLIWSKNHMSATPVRENTAPIVTGGSDCQRKRRAYIALGSNLGNRITMIERACKEMSARGIKVRRTSSLWETEPMYVLEQGTFINGACEVGMIFVCSGLPILLRWFCSDRFQACSQCLHILPCVLFLVDLNHEK
jgi:hypothetical protein